MKLSVCILTYNHAGFVSTTLESVLKQETDLTLKSSLVMITPLMAL